MEYSRGVGLGPPPQSTPGLPGSLDLSDGVGKGVRYVPETVD